MKKQIFISLLGILIVLNTTAQGKNEYKNSVRIGTLPLIRGAAHISYEKILDKSSFVTIGEITSFKTDYTQVKGYMGELQYRFFIVKNEMSTGIEMEHFYFAPFVSYRYFNQIKSGYNDKINTSLCGALLGVRLSNAQRLVLDFNIGPAYRYSDLLTERRENDYDNNILGLGYNGITLAGNITVGVKF